MAHEDDGFEPEQMTGCGTNATAAMTVADVIAIKRIAFSLLFFRPS